MGRLFFGQVGGLRDKLTDEREAAERLLPNPVGKLPLSKDGTYIAGTEVPFEPGDFFYKDGPLTADKVEALIPKASG